MLKRLTIDNYALIDHLDISFPDGLIIITGETGAGKSILLGALSLLLGAKADSSVISDKERNCVVEGEFDISGSDVDSGEIPLFGTSLIFRRVISSSGRSRSFINDEPVSVATLSALSSHLVDIHAQHNHLLLSDENYQISILDYFAANGALLAEYRKLYEEHGLLLKELEDMRERAERLKGEVEYKQYQLDKIEQASITDDNELEELKARMKELEERRFRLFFDSQDLALDSHEASEYYIDRLSQEAYLIDGARNLLERLYGDYRLVVITNGIARVQRGRLARLGLTGLFSHIVISGEIGASKPSAEFFDRTLEITGAGRKDCLVIGDSLTSDMKGALDNGFDALYLHLGKQDVQVPEGIKYDAESYAQLADIIYAD